jgi:hypothetical protein
VTVKIGIPPHSVLLRHGVDGADERKSVPPRETIFGSGLPLEPQRWLGFFGGVRNNVVRRALVAVLVSWVPLAVLTAFQSLVFGSDGLRALLWDASVHARFLLAAPLFVLAEIECGRRLDTIIYHFDDAGLIEGQDQQKFDDLVSSTRRWINSRWIAFTLGGLACLLVAMATLSQPIGLMPSWHKAGGAADSLSLAGWWHVLVCLPMLLVLMIGWMWRLAVWAWLLWRIGQLDLRLVASHPDHAAGLGFVGYSARAFQILAFAFAAMLAGRSANSVLQGGNLPTQALEFNAGVLLALVALFVAPLLAFLPILVRTWRQGTLEYSALANWVGAAFENKWLRRDGPVDKRTTEKDDFSTTVDLYGIVENVHALKYVPIDVKSVAFLAVATILPFVPVLFLAIPTPQIVEGLRKILF